MEQLQHARHWARKKAFSNKASGCKITLMRYVVQYGKLSVSFSNSNSSAMIYCELAEGIFILARNIFIPIFDKMLGFLIIYENPKNEKLRNFLNVHLLQRILRLGSVCCASHLGKKFSFIFSLLWKQFLMLVEK